MEITKEELKEMVSSAVKEQLAAKQEQGILFQAQ